MRSGTRATTAASAKKIKMHREILGVTNPATLVDHINGDRLDNRRVNLRVATPQANSLNRRSLGVYFDTARGLYRYQVRVGSKSYNGRLKSKQAAIRKVRKLRRIILGGLYK